VSSIRKAEADVEEGEKKKWLLVAGCYYYPAKAALLNLEPLTALQDFSSFLRPNSRMRGAGFIHPVTECLTRILLRQHLIRVARH
jgi:hypothetical protein